MVNPMSRVDHQAARAQEIKAAAPKTVVEKIDAKKTAVTGQIPAAPVSEKQETKVLEVKEKPAIDSVDALRTLASREQNNSQAAPGRNMLSADAVISAYKN